jgi:Holliday junction resolvase RusA-like endonuclease
MAVFTVPGVPVAQPRQHQRIVTAGDGRAFATNYLPRDHAVNDYKATARILASQNFTAPLAGPIELRVTFVLPRPKGMIWKRREMPRARHDKKPDADNLVKALKDSLKGIAWNDDSQVCVMRVEKWIASGQEGASTFVEIMAIVDAPEFDVVDPVRPMTAEEIEGLCRRNGD